MPSRSESFQTQTGECASVANDAVRRTRCKESRTTQLLPVDECNDKFNQVVAISLPSGDTMTVDRRDARRVLKHSWRAFRRPDGTVKAVQGVVKGRQIGVHRFILRPPSSKMVDHIDGDPLNNVRKNLRACYARNNSANSRGHADAEVPFKGVSRVRRRAGLVFVAKICTLHIGTFKTAREAAVAYDNEAKARYGKFACLNFPDFGSRTAIPPLDFRRAAYNTHDYDRRAALLLDRADALFGGAP